MILALGGKYDRAVAADFASTVARTLWLAKFVIMAQSHVQPCKAPGLGYVCAKSFGPDSSKVSALSSTYPVRLISPSSQPGERAVLVFILNHGGGLVAGDEIDLRAEVLCNARLGLLTQGSTKIYKSLPGAGCTTQTLRVTVGAGAGLVVLPDPVQPFRDSVYKQDQSFEIDPLSSSILLLDWVSEGRSAHGERWSLTEWKGRNEIWSLPTQIDGEERMERRLLLRDNIMLYEKSPMLTQSLEGRMEELGVFGTLIIRGPLFEGLGKLFLDQYARQPRIGVKKWSTGPGAVCSEDEEDGTAPGNTSGSLMWTATSVRGFVVVRFGTATVEHARHWLRDMLTSDGTVEKEFGKRYLFCLQDH